MQSVQSSRVQTMTDARGAAVTVPRYPNRIVSLIPSITETLFDFGLSDKIAGRTTYCVRPSGSVDAVPVIGGTKNLNIDIVCSHRPDLVIANIEENEQHDVELLEKRGIPVFVTFPRTVLDSFDLLKTLAALTGADAASKTYIEAAERVMNAIREAAASIEKKPRIAYLIWRKPYMTVNRDTYIHDMITFCGGVNVFSEYPNRYPEVRIEDISRAQPDMIILPSEPYRFLEKHRQEIMSYNTIPAVKMANVLRADGEMFSWYGTRMIHGLHYVREIISRVKMSV